MNIQSIIILSIILFIFVKMIIKVYKNRGKCGSCGGNCDSCSMSCHSKDK